MVPVDERTSSRRPETRLVTPASCWALVCMAGAAHAPRKRAGRAATENFIVAVVERVTGKE